MRQDPSLNDEPLEREIQLVGELVLAASSSAGPLPQAAIDAALGLGSADQADSAGQAGQAGQAEPDAAGPGPAQPPDPDPAETAPGARHPAKGLSL